MCSPSQKDGLNICTSTDEFTCKQADTGEKPRRGKFKTAVSSSPVRRLLKHREGRKLGGWKDRWGEIQPHLRISPSRQRQAGGRRSAAATRGQGWEQAAREAAQHSSAWHTEAVPCPTQRDSPANDTEQEYDQISEIRLTPSHGSLSQEEAQKRVEENRKDW